MLVCSALSTGFPDKILPRAPAPQSLAWCRNWCTVLRWSLCAQKELVSLAQPLLDSLSGGGAGGSAPPSEYIGGDFRWADVPPPLSS